MGNYLSSVQGEGKKVHEEEAGAGDAQALITPALPECPSVHILSP